MSDTFIKLPSGDIVNLRYIQKTKRINQTQYEVHLLRTFIKLGETDYKALEKILLEGNT